MRSLGLASLGLASLVVMGVSAQAVAAQPRSGIYGVGPTFAAAKQITDSPLGSRFPSFGEMFVPIEARKIRGRRFPIKEAVVTSFAISSDACGGTSGVEAFRVWMGGETLSKVDRAGRFKYRGSANEAEEGGRYLGRLLPMSFEGRFTSSTHASGTYQVQGCSPQHFFALYNATLSRGRRPVR
jgi:hypothetical protein